MSSKTKLVEGLVMNLLNEREIAINIGSDDGVEPGMRFKILAAEPFEMRDPATGELLGTIHREKTRVEAVDVQARLSICQTYRVIEPPRDWLPQMPGIRRPLFAFGRTRAVYEKVQADETAALPPLEGPERYIRRGDRVVQLTYEDE